MIIIYIDIFVYMYIYIVFFVVVFYYIFKWFSQKRKESHAVMPLNHKQATTTN